MVVRMLLVVSALMIQSCDCHGTWSDNIRKMDQCLKEHKKNEQFCLKKKDKIDSCRPIIFDE